MNLLSTARSAYLRSAAHQPVHWYPWGPEAFALAREHDRPVLLDIGAVWCHWCHVMDGESYEDPGLAAYLNEHFVCVKVDRDERPDVDTRYQRAVQAFSGQGGWPLTAFLTPEGEVFYGGTYFPPDGRYRAAGVPPVLESVVQAYRDKGRELRTQAASVSSVVRGQPGRGRTRGTGRGDPRGCGPGDGAGVRFPARRLRHGHRSSPTLPRWSSCSTAGDGRCRSSAR